MPAGRVRRGRRSAALTNAIFQTGCCTAAKYSNQHDRSRPPPALGDRFTSPADLNNRRAHSSHRGGPGNGETRRSRNCLRAVRGGRRRQSRTANVQLPGEFRRNAALRQRPYSVPEAIVQPPAGVTDSDVKERPTAAILGNSLCAWLLRGTARGASELLGGAWSGFGRKTGANGGRVRPGSAVPG